MLPVEGKVDVPSDVYNGMLSVLIRNLPAADRTRVHMMAFTPKPRLVEVELGPAGEDTFYVGGAKRRARQYRANLELPGTLRHRRRRGRQEPARPAVPVHHRAGPIVREVRGPLLRQRPDLADRDGRSPLEPVRRLVPLSKGARRRLHSVPNSCQRFPRGIWFADSSLP